jgi:SAM-dependent methyltransferase
VRAFRYEGSELEIFARASNWKTLVRNYLRRYLQGEVLEVGAGIGANTVAYASLSHTRWTCLEPDPRLAARIPVHEVPQCEVIVGKLPDIPTERHFDTILYLDVLEHIEDDRAELLQAASHLRPNGTLCVLSPAHPWLYSPFDRAIGHHRRYAKRTLESIGPPGLNRELTIYLDSVGMLASLGNRLFLRSASPTPWQIWLWDRVMVPVSRLLDPIVLHRLGKSVLAVWRRPAQ